MQEDNFPRLFCFVASAAAQQDLENTYSFFLRR
jgi:hypothetical protein